MRADGGDMNTGVTMKRPDAPSQGLRRAPLGSIGGSRPPGGGPGSAAVRDILIRSSAPASPRPPATAYVPVQHAEKSSGPPPGYRPAPTVFGVRPVDPARFVLVAAPIGQGPRFALNIYEQAREGRACFAVERGAAVEAVNPLLREFDFTGICRRYVDGNGYSVRIGQDDLGSRYRLSVVRQAGDLQLQAIPAGGQAGSPMVVARAGGDAEGFVNLRLEPGWKLMQREFQGKPIGHMVLYRDNWP